ncbi:MAG: heme-binding protein [Phenylobacterium sp.]
MIRTLAFALVLLAAGPAAAQQIPEPNGAPISLAQAQRIVAAAEAEARRLNFRMAFAVVEPDGELVAFERIDGTQYGSIEVAQAKARSAARFRRATKVFADQVAGGATGALSLPGVIAIEGGVPIVEGGRMVGALGVSGGTSVQDGQVAQAALAAQGR